MKLTKLAFKNIFRNRRRSILSGSAIAVATMSIVLLFSFLEGMTTDMEENQKVYVLGNIRVRHFEYSKYERLNPVRLIVNDLNNKIDLIGEEEWVTAISPRVKIPGSVFLDGKTFGVYGFGVDFDQEADFQNLEETLIEGRLPEVGSKEGLIGEGLANRMGLDIGDEFRINTITTRNMPKRFKVVISGIVRIPVGAMDNSYVMIPIDKAQSYLVMNDSASEILVRIDESKITDEEAEAILKDKLTAVDSKIEVASWMSDNLIMSMLKYADIIYGFFGIFFFVLGSTVIINTTMMVIFERMREIGTLGAMGMKGKDLTRLFFLEALFISIMGAVAGAILGIILSILGSIFGIPMGTVMEGIDMEISNVLYMKLNLLKTLFVLIFSILTASVATFYPSKRASKIMPVDALRYV